MQERQASLDRPGLLQGADDLVVARRIERHGRPALGQRAEDRNRIVAFLLPGLVFRLVLEIGAQRDRVEAERIANVRSVGRAAAGGGQA